MKTKVRIVWGTGFNINQSELVYRLSFSTDQSSPWPSYIVTIFCPSCGKKHESRIQFPDDVLCVGVLCGACSTEFRANCKPVNCFECEERIDCLRVETTKIPFKRTYRQKPQK